MSKQLQSAFGMLRNAIDKKAAARAKLTVHAKDLADDGEPYVPVGLHGIMASTEKLLAVNRGLVPTDERDSLQYKKTFRTSDLLGERVRLDADKLRRSLLRKAAKTRTLKGLHPFYFDPYAEKHLIGNPLSSPLEEINPMQLVEQARRVTLMGPGGVGSSQAITDEMQNLHPSSFGFLSSLEGPESEKIGIDSRMAMGTKMGSNGRIYQKFWDNRKGKYRYMSPEDLDGLVLKLPD